MKESSHGPEGEQYTLNYDGVIPYHSGAIKYLIEENQELKEEVNKISIKMSDLTKKTDELSIEVQTLKEIIQNYIK
jgi:glutamate synthase domain-containing protein 3